ncbi:MULTISPECIES: CBS domain-containing protein [unclassified Methylophaga]|jgi:CBS domain-containing protein|uniref:CBS domain-containing protein n=1 Tax=unclassified Methylophaga TaxID=2629249 RepID=UPI0025D71692|nr:MULTISPECIES: CBS domain-containing protein [unclassified Methylophaga]|tara:strand:- start:18114 stop:18539 length:426 start_codon:yes stop_codon:yes gene_type:complete
MLRVKDVMTKQPFYLDADVSIQEVSQIMRDKNLGFVPLSKENRIIGVITDRDIALRVVAEAKDPHQKARNIATERVLYTYEDKPIEEVVQNMADQQVQRFLVLNNAKNEELVGIVTLGDIADRCKDEAMAKKVINAARHYH